MSLLRATAALLLESDIRFAALLSSFRNDLAGFWQIFRFSSLNGAQIEENPIRQAKFREFARRSVANTEPSTPKKRPRSSQGGPKGTPRGPVGCQEGPTGATGGLPRHPDTSETISAFRKLKNSSFESSRWRESLEKRIRYDFLSIFESRAQTRKCKKHIRNTMFFCDFRRSRLLRKSAQSRVSV